jgi:hypothetical protein
VDEIADAAMDENIAGLEFEQRRLQDTGVGTTDPKDPGLYFKPGI